METRKAKRAREIMEEIDRLQEIKDVIVEDLDLRWGGLTPNVKRRDNNGLELPESLRARFADAVDAAIKDVEYELGEL